MSVAEYSEFYASKSCKFWRSAIEMEEDEVAEVTGKIPPWLKGTYLRVGPGLFDLGKPGQNNGFTMNHWWDGYSIISRFQIRDGSVKFSKKFLDSTSYKKALTGHKPAICEFGTPAYPEKNKSIFSKMMNLIPELTDNANLNLFNIEKEVFVTAETSFFHHYNVKCMNSTERLDTNKLFGVNIALAHPITDPSTGITYHIGNTLITGLKYNIIEIPAPTSPNQTPKDLMKKSKILASVPSRWSTCMGYNHSFGLSQHYIVICEQPFLINVSKIVGSVITREKSSFSDWLEWRGEYTNRFYVIDKKSGKIVCNKIEYHASPFFFLHFINVYEEEGQVVIDLLGFDNPSMLEETSLSKLRAGTGPEPEESRSYHMRFVLPLNESDLADTEDDLNLVRVKSEAKAFKRSKSYVHLTPEILTERGLEMPQINKNFIGRKNRYFYASGLISKGYYEASVVKIDLERKEHLIWREHKSFMLGEPIFVPSPKYIEDSRNSNERDEEDDGILIVPCTDDREDAKDFIMFLDATNLKELGKASFNAVIPPSIHGLYVANI